MTERYLRPLRPPAFVTRLVIRYVEWVIGHRLDVIAPLNTVRHIDCPILLVHGQDDRVVLVADARRILANCRAPGARLLEVAGAGHDSVDRIEGHIPELLEFLDGGRRGQGPLAHQGE